MGALWESSPRILKIRCSRYTFRLDSENRKLCVLFLPKLKVQVAIRTLKDVVYTSSETTQRDGYVRASSPSLAVEKVEKWVQFTDEYIQHMPYSHTYERWFSRLYITTPSLSLLAFCWVSSTRARRKKSARRRGQSICFSISAEPIPPSLHKSFFFSTCMYIWFRDEYIYILLLLAHMRIVSKIQWISS